MRVQGTKSETIDVEITDSTVTNIVTSGLDLGLTLRGVWQSFLKQQKLQNPGNYLKDGKWQYEYEVRGGSHGWDDIKIVRDATDAEIAFVELYDQLVQARLLLELKGT